jgi:hypothetical protein
MISAARSARWMAPPSGLALVGFAAWASLHLLSGGQSVSTNTSAAALQPVPAPSLARPISPAPPPLAEAPLDQARAPSPPVTQAVAGPAQHKTVKWRARRRSPLIVRRGHTWFAHRWTPVFMEPCRYQCDWMEPTAWHGGGY